MNRETKNPVLGAACWRVLALMLLVAGQAAQALDPRVDPSRPNSQVPQLLRHRGYDTGDRLNFPAKPEFEKDETSGQAGRIVIKRVRFEGNQALSTESLEAVARPYLNRPITASDLEHLRYQLTLLYVNNGYISSGAEIPEQSIESGELRVRLVEGRLTDVKVTDITDQTDEYRLWPLRDEYVQDRLASDEDEPLNTADLQRRYLMLLNDRLVERLNANLLPGLHPGDAVLDVKVTRSRPYGGYLGIDNFTPPQIGGLTGRLGFWVDNLSTFGERIDFNMSPTGGSFSYNTGIDIPLNAIGTRFAFRYTNADTVLIEAPFDTLNIMNNIISYDGQLSHPVYWDLDTKVTLGLNFGVRQNQMLFDNRPFPSPASLDGLTQATVIRNWQDYLYQGEAFDAAFRSTFTVGVNALGATVTSLPGVGSGEFFAWVGQGVTRYRFESTGAYASLKGAVQATGNNLLAIEKMAIGGFWTVRGYRQNYLVRDQGFYVSLEGGYPIYGGGAGEKYGLYIVPFTDYGGGSDQDQQWTYLQSVGIGLEGNVKLTDAILTGGFYWAGRLTNNYRGDTGSFPYGAPYTAQDNGINFQINLQTM